MVSRVARGPWGNGEEQGDKTYQVSLQRDGGVAITLTLSGHAVPLLLGQLGEAVGLGAVVDVLDTVLAAVDDGGAALAAGAAVGAEALLGGGVHVHHVDILGAGAGAGGGAAAGAGLGAGAVDNVGGVDTELVEGVVHLGQRHLLRLARDDGLVLEALLHLGLVADEGLLLADQLGLGEHVGLLLVVELLVRLVVALLLEALLLLLEGLQLGVDLRVDEVVDVLAVPHLGDLVVLPLGVLEEPVLAHVHAVDAGATVVGLDVLGEAPALRVVAVVLLEVLDALGDEGLQGLGGTGLGDVDTGHDVGEAAANVAAAVGAGIELLGDALGNETLADGVLDALDALLRVARQLEHLDLARLEQALELRLGRGVEVLGLDDVDLVDNNEDNLVLEQGLDALEEVDLGLDRVAALLTQVHEVQNGGAQMGDGGNGLHLNGVPMQRLVTSSHESRESGCWLTSPRGGGREYQGYQCTGSEEKRLGRESIRLDVDVGSGDGLEERRLSNIGETRDEQGSGVGVDRGKTAKIWVGGQFRARLGESQVLSLTLSDLVKVHQGVLEALDERRHATKRGALQLLALEQRLAILEKANVVSGDGLDEVLGGGQLAEGDLEVVGVVEGVDQVLVEGVDVVEARERLDDLAELLADGLLGELDLAGVEAADSRDLETGSDLGRQPALRPREDNVEELLRVGDRGEVLPPKVHRN
ncbi:conserved hypothetical protein [Colletotrichum tofieldiae]|nr:conserved hypothetical protein [Colletotrichum tofieldiae]